MELLVSVLLFGAYLISILSLVALGLGVVYGLLGVINMAHGEFIAIGAYTAVVVTEAGLSYWLALVVALAVGMVLGVILESTLINRLIRRPLDAILVTLGLGLVVQQILQAIFGAAPRSVAAPVHGSIQIFGVNYPNFRLVVVSIAVITIAATFVFFAKSSFGLVVRAIFSNRDAALTNGVNAGRYNRLAFGLGSALAAFAGCLIAPSANVLPQMGTFYLGPAFIAVVLGGSGRLLGAVVGAALMGGLEVLMGEYLTQTLARSGVLVLAVILIRLRPGGLVRQPQVRVA